MGLLSRLSASLGLALMISGCFARVALPVEPQEPEGHFVRACELLEPADRLRAQADTMAALAAIRPPGRFCFVCRRLRRCQQALERLGRDPGPTAAQLVRETTSRLGDDPAPDPPPEGGPNLQELGDQLCRACASMPRRIQDGAWDLPEAP